jgi:hypothetical protein
MTPRPARPNHDPDRVPGAPPGYLRTQSGARLGSCDRCGVIVEVTNPTAKELHEKYHAALRAMWATARPGRPE